jgi:23S rRNA (adenine2030-N6)-methyltransferase
LLSYRHSFHAGNFADVLKHIVLVEILRHLMQKDKAIHYIDTHAGAGLFDLTSVHAAKLHEYRDGIGRLDAAEWPELSTYFDIVRTCNRTEKLTAYPGSPTFAMHFLREQDRAWLFELHPEDARLLAADLGRDRRVKVEREDGFSGLLRLVPPVSRRGLVMLDPSYEIKTDYAKVVQTVRQAHRVFPTGTYAIWYPVIERSRVDRLIRELSATGIPDVQRFELCVRPDASAPGLTGAGMIVINPPWTLMAQMQILLPRLATALGRERSASCLADTLAAES